MKFKVGDLAVSIASDKKVQIVALGRSADACFGRTLNDGRIFFYHCDELKPIEDPNNLLKKML